VPATAELGGLSLGVGLLMGLPIGVLSAVRRGSLFDNVSRVMAVIFSAVPIFWLGLTLLLIFGSQLHLLPMGGRHSTDYFITGEVSVMDRIKHLILPVSVLSSGWVAVFSRFMRASTLDVLSQDYIRTAKAKGLREQQVWFVHASRNALIPIATILGPALPGIIGGALITETIFSWPGVGRTAYGAVLAYDYPVIMATVILVSFTTIIGYLLSDILYALIDPRIRLS
jgi:peptide/nickel transport system permease protein